MDRREINELIHGKMLGWVCGVPKFKDLSEHDYRRLVLLLEHKKSRVRSLSANRLGKEGRTDATASLVKALDDPHWLVRMHAAKALGRISAEDSLDPLLSHLNDDNASVRRQIVSALSRVSNLTVLPSLLDALKDEDRCVRSLAARSLYKFREESVIEALSIAAADPDKDVSWRAFYSLLAIGKGSTLHLTRLLSSENPETRYRAARTLGRLGSLRSYFMLLILRFDRVKKVRIGARQALRSLNQLLKRKYKL